MAGLELTGKLTRKLAVQNGQSARGAWCKQEFVLEFQDGNFPASACFNVWGEDKVKELEAYQLGDDLTVSFHINSREFNGKWYTDLKAWKIARTAPAQASPAPAPTFTAPGIEDLPAGFAPQASAPTVDNIPDGGDDLPF